MAEVTGNMFATSLQVFEKKQNNSDVNDHICLLC